MISGYEIDPVARIDITAELRYRWFDWIMKGGPRPRLLADRINYEVVGANRWKHAPSIAAMSNGTLRFYLRHERSGSGYRLAPAAPARDTSVTLMVDLAELRQCPVRTRRWRRRYCDRHSECSGLYERSAAQRY
jgi:hypothetical protein